MQVYSVCRLETRLGFLLILLFTGSLCYGDDRVLEVVGTAECGDCEQSNIKSSHALSGLKVTIECKLENGKLKTRGVGELNVEGKFNISLPKEIMKDGKLTEECYVQLHNAANAPCGVHDGALDAIKVNFLSKSDQKHTFGPTGKLKFSSAVCTSAFLWPFYKYPPLPNVLPHWPKKHLFFGHHFPLPPKVYPSFPFPPKAPFKKWFTPPVYEAPVVPPPTPVYKPTPEPPVDKPKPPVYKPTPKPPVVKPEPPVHKPHVHKPKPKAPKCEPKPKPPVYKPAPVPTYKPKPPVASKPPPVPISKPKPPVVEPPPVPIYKPTPKPPVVYPPPVPIYKPLPPFYKKPCPPFPHPKLPPFTYPPKHFHHHIIKDLPPLPPLFSHP